MDDSPAARNGETMHTRERDRLAKGAHPSYKAPPKRGARCPRCHVTNNPRRCALCNPPPADTEPKQCSNPNCDDDPGFCSVECMRALGIDW